MCQDHEQLFSALRKSSFRRRFTLKRRERTYMDRHGMDLVLAHARRFVEERLQPAHPIHDGKQTPMRGHPVFVAQHATATCCRSCLWRWHKIPRYRPLTDAQIERVVAVIGYWLASQGQNGPPNQHVSAEPDLFSAQRSG